MRFARSSTGRTGRGSAWLNLMLAAMVLVAPRLAAQQDTTEIGRLKAQVEAITRELEELKLGKEVVARADTSSFGFGPAASKVYRGGEGVSIGGYGEFAYRHDAAARQDGTPSGGEDQIDALRGIVYVGYKFTPRVLFNSELEFEHASTERAGAVSLEFGYVEYGLSPRFGVRGGLLLVPMGFLNELHEPPIFLGSTRPVTEQFLVPSTWAENGVGVFGQTGGLSYRAYLLNGFDAVGGRDEEGEGFTAEEGLRGGRQGGSEALAETFGLAGRLEYATARGITVGVSGYLGDAGQAESFGARTVIGEGHAQYRARGFDLRGLVAIAGVGDAVEINAAKGLVGSESVGSRLLGWYVQAGYDVLRPSRTGHQLIPYVRYEQLNTQDDVPSGFRADPANDRSILALGMAWKPIPNVALKADYQIQRNQAKTGANRLQVNLGYLF